MDQPNIHISSSEPTNFNLNSKHSIEKNTSIVIVAENELQDSSSSSNVSPASPLRHAQRVAKVLWKFAKFTGPGAIISVAYIDPDNYQSDLTAGALFEYKLLCAVVFSNLVAVFLQVSLCSMHT